MNIPNELQYSKSHEWLYMDNGSATVGLTSYAEDKLGDIVYVSLPEPGDPVSAGEPFGEVESVKAVSNLFSPVTGVVLEVNEEVVEDPSMINVDPYWAWLIRVGELTGQEELLDSAAYEAHCAAKEG